MLGLSGAERRVCFVPDYLCDKLYISETQQYENNTVTIRRGGGVCVCEGLYLHSTHQKEAWPTFLSAMHSLLCEGHSETKSNS